MAGSELWWVWGRVRELMIQVFPLYVNRENKNSRFMSCLLIIAEGIDSKKRSITESYRSIELCAYVSTVQLFPQTITINKHSSSACGKNRL